MWRALGALWLCAPRGAALWAVQARVPRPAAALDVAHVPDLELFVTDDGGREIAWIDVYRTTGGFSSGSDVALHARPARDSEAARCFGSNLLVDTAMRRRGVATSLLLEVENTARAWGAKECLLTALRSHAPSCELYEKLGYDVVASDLGRQASSVLLGKPVDTQPCQ